MEHRQEEINVVRFTLLRKWKNIHETSPQLKTEFRIRKLIFHSCTYGIATDVK